MLRSVHISKALQIFLSGGPGFASAQCNGTSQDGDDVSSGE